MFPTEKMTKVYQVGLEWTRSRRELEQQRAGYSNLLPYNRLIDICAQVAEQVEVFDDQSEYVSRLLLLMKETLALPANAVISGKFPAQAALKWMLEGDNAEFLEASERLVKEYWGESNSSK